MSTKKPKDLHLGEIAYNAFYSERPQIFFDDLNGEAQMKWVRLCRSVIEEYKRTTPGTTQVRAAQKRVVDNLPDLESLEKEKKRRERDKERKRVKREALANGQIAYKRKPTKGFPAVPIEEKQELWEAGDKEDVKFLTNRNWTSKSKAEVQAIQRMHYRNKQRLKYGLETVTHNPINN